ncbi:MAG: hypothetical protein IT379_13625 [Deltaproteobacteria bacterium]|nr:hypothetical protein [Deltaproteobacteria bacterium]
MGARPLQARLVWGHFISTASLARGLALALLVLAGPLATGCGDTVDPAFATPDATLRSLLRSHRLDTVAADVLRDRIARRERFRVTDHGLYRSCFTSFRDEPETQGLAGFVLGAIARSRGQWRTAIGADGVHATVRAGSHARIELVRDDERGWRIDLHRSVPVQVQRQMAELGRRVRERYAHDGLPTD